MTRRLWILTAALTAACGGNHDGATGGPEMLSDLKVDAAPANGFQIVLPIVRGVAPGTSVEYCTYTDKILDRDLQLKGSMGYQTPGGHHVALFYTMTPVAAGTTQECTDKDMGSMRFASASRGEGRGGADILPGNLVITIPAGAQLVVNHHYLNASASAIDAQSAVNVLGADPGIASVPAGPVAVVDTGMRATPGVSTTEILCKAPSDMPLWLLFPHMHQWGQHVTVDRVGADGSTESLFDVPWTSEYVFDPPMMRRDPSSPYVLKAGDALRVRCTWNNTTGSDLTFGLEMCVAFGETVGGGGNVACDQGKWFAF